LLRKAKAKSSLDSLARSRKLERKKLKAEISALKNPGSLVARKSLRSATSKFGGFLKKRATIINENLSALEEKERKKKRTSTPRRRKTTRRRVRRR